MGCISHASSPPFQVLCLGAEEVTPTLQTKARPSLQFLSQRWAPQVFYDFYCFPRTSRVSCRANLSSAKWKQSRRNVEGAVACPPPPPAPDGCPGNWPLVSSPWSSNCCLGKCPICREEGLWVWCNCTGWGKVGASLHLQQARILRCLAGTGPWLVPWDLQHTVAFKYSSEYLNAPCTHVYPHAHA